MSINELYLIVGTVGGLLLIGGILRKTLPPVAKFWRRLNGTLDAINGRPSFVDQASGEHVDELPPLTSRMATVEKAVVEMTDLMKQQTAFDRRLGNAERRLGEHDAAIAAIAAGHLGQLERIVTKAESASMWQAAGELARQGDPGPASEPPFVTPPAE